MKINCSVLAVLLAGAAVLAGPARGREKTPRLGEDPLGKVIAAMTLEEKALLVVGDNDEGDRGDIVGYSRKVVPGTAGATCPIPRLGIPATVLADGPAGLRIKQPLPPGDPKEFCTSFPVATALAATWNPALVERVGAAIGNELLEHGCDILLAPALNIHRNPLCGRNYEYYSEDPLLSGRLAAAYVRGVQSQGVGATLKHYVANNQETNRKYIDEIIDLRTMKEIYLRGFSIAVREGKPWAVMSSYNKINGRWVAERPDLLVGELRGVMGFDGLVMTDWNSKADLIGQLRACNSLSMPGHRPESQRVIEAVQSGELTEEELDRNVRYVLEYILKTPRFRGYEYGNRPDTEANHAVSRRAAEEAVVLLRNEGGCLPLASETRVMLFGVNAYDYIKGGGGSGDVNSCGIMNLDRALAEAGLRVDTELEPLYRSYLALQIANNRARFPKKKYRDAGNFPELAIDRGTVDRKVSENDAVLFVLGRNSGEFADRTLEGDLCVTPVERELIRNLSESCRAAGKPFVVVLNVAGVVETDWKEQADAIVLGWLLGQKGAQVTADVVTGRVNPSGKLPMTLPVRYGDVPSSRNFPGTPAPLPTRVDYEEGIYVGYRHYDKFDVAPSYEFGYGLSYTTFTYGGMRVDRGRKGSFVVSVEVRNTGGRPGRETVQLYVKAPEGSLDKPEQELRAFGKTRLLQPGESERLVFELAPLELASYDGDLMRWIASAGEYEFRIGASSRDIRCRQTAVLARDVVKRE